MYPNPNNKERLQIITAMQMDTNKIRLARITMYACFKGFSALRTTEKQSQIGIMPITSAIRAELKLGIIVSMDGIINLTM